jgi:hypothetical protein
VQCAAAEYVERLTARSVSISMAAVGQSEENGFALGADADDQGRGGGTEYRDFADARRRLGRFVDAVYNGEQIHSALGYLTPAEFEQQWRRERAAPSAPPKETVENGLTLGAHYRSICWTDFRSFSRAELVTAHRRCVRFPTT